MVKRKYLLFYVLVIGFFSLAIWALLKLHLPGVTPFDAPSGMPHTGGKVDMFLTDFVSNITHPLGILLLQIISIILVSRVFSFFFRKIHQPTVIGEILAGIALGPSLLGLFLPEVSGFIFPKTSLPNLQMLSQVGLILFMFIIGMDLDVEIIRKKAREAVVISHASIIFPFFLGVVLAMFIYAEHGNTTIGFTPFALFMGIAMSITAFPVLARIVQERGLTKTMLGSMAITCAAADDVTAWCILAAVIAITKAGSIMNAGVTIALSAVYVLFMLYAVRPILAKAGNIYTSRENLSRNVIAVILLVLLASAYVAEVIGIHALFGAFLAGVIMPHNLQFKKVLSEKVEDISLVLLLPLFFVFTGLRTEIGLLNDSHLWLLCAAVTGVAVLGKLGGSTLAARFVGQTWRNSFAIGALMNTRGLMELIVLNIGYDLGILSPQIFAIMVIMALVTTFMTGPLLHLIDYIFGKAKPEEDESGFEQRVLLSFGRFEMGSTLLRIARLLTFKQDKVIRYTAMHITPTSDISVQEALNYEQEAFQPVTETARDLSLPLQTYYKAADQVGVAIVNKANRENYDLLLVGAARSVFNEDILGGKIRSILDTAHSDVAVFSDRGMQQLENILLMIYSREDRFLLRYAEMILANTTTSIITILDVSGLQATEPEVFMHNADSHRVHVTTRKLLDQEFLQGYDLIMVHIQYWHHIIESKSQWITYSPSVLILRDKKI
jgi:Kef-type K+ transport system membrane component KefB/nucleotide-binding universal stress UspA family protein